MRLVERVRTRNAHRRAVNMHRSHTGTTTALWPRGAKELVMFSWAIGFFIVALIAAVLGFGGLAASAAGIAKIIFIVALILAIISFVAGRRPPLT